MRSSIFLILALLTISVTSFSQDQLVVDPNATMRTLTKSFSKIKVSNGIDIYLSQADAESIAVSASDDKYLEKLVTVVEGDQLKIYYDHNGSWTPSDKKLKVYIAFKKIDELEASGSSDVVVAGTLTAEDLKLKLSGSSDFKGNVKAGKLIIDLSGSSDVNISGTASILNLENSGASDLKGYDLAVDVCHAKSSGASDVRITVNKEISVEASGASDVYYRGGALVKSLKSSGSSTVAKRDL